MCVTEDPSYILYGECLNVSRSARSLNTQKRLCTSYTVTVTVDSALAMLRQAYNKLFINSGAYVPQTTIIGSLLRQRRHVRSSHSAASPATVCVVAKHMPTTRTVAVSKRTMSIYIRRVPRQSSLSSLGASGSGSSKVSVSVALPRRFLSYKFQDPFEEDREAREKAIKEEAVCIVSLCC
jgi:hypothetical protein